MKKLCVLFLLVLGVFAGQALAQKGTFVAPMTQAPPTSEGELASGRWTAFDWGQYTVAKDNETVMIFSTWDPLVEKAEHIFNWRQDQFKKSPDVTAKLVTKCMDVPGVVNVIAAKHRLEIYRANVYTWEILVPRLLQIFAGSELAKAP